MTDSPEDLAAVEQLLAERDALHGWLTKLDQAPVAAPDRVRERVRRDYQQRLDHLTAGLRAHADVIASKLADDRREHEDLSARATAAREALAEAELRHAVGEFDRARFDTERTRYRSDIESFEISLVAVAERIARLEDVHRLVDRAPQEPADTALVGAPESAPESTPEVHVIGEVDEELIAIADLAPDADPDEVLAIFTDDEGEADRPAPRSSGPTTPPVESAGPLSFRPSGHTGENPVPRSAVAPPARPRGNDAAPLGIPSANVPPRFVRPGERIRSVPASPVTPASSVSEPGSDAPEELFHEEIVAAGPATEPPALPVNRTLRCSECGAMNRPLEWYCEKCGAELTAV